MYCGHTSCYFRDSLGSGTIPYKSAVGGGRPSRSTNFCSVLNSRTTPSTQSSNSPRAVRKSITIRNRDDNFAGAAAWVMIGHFCRTFASSLLPHFACDKAVQVASGHTVPPQERRFLQLSQGRRYRRSQVASEQTIINSLRLPKHYIRYRNNTLSFG